VSILPDVKLFFVLRALRHRNYRLFFFGQGMSLIGTWMQSLALSWLVFRLTGDEFKLGLVGFAGQLPNLVLAPMSGVFADRWDRRGLLLATQTLSMIQAAVLAALVLSGFVHQASDAWYLIGMSLVLGVINSVDIPVRQSFVVEMVGSREDLASAIPLNSFLVNGTRFLGPSLAGFVVAWWGEGLCFLLNSASYLAVIAALAAMKLSPRQHCNRKQQFRHELHEGLTYAWNTSHIRLVLLFLAVVSLVGIPYMVLMPAFAKDVFHGDARTQGLLLGMVGAGAVCGTFFLASQRSTLGLGRIMVVGSAVFGAALVAFSFCGVAWQWIAPRICGRTAAELPPNLVFWLAAPILATVGFGQVAQLVAGNTLLQMVVDDDKRGRVMSLHTVAFLGITPFGSLFAGMLARHIGPTRTVFAGGVLCLIGTAVFSARLSALQHAIAVSKAGSPEITPYR
jgi:MFS family permease